MASWSTVVEQSPELASAVMTAFDASKHKVLATLRADGSPRVSGTELELHAGELYLGSMPGARKAADLRRDPRFALHSAPVDLDLAKVPDVKIAGTAGELVSPEEWAAYAAAAEREAEPGSFHLFRLDVTEVVRTWVADDLLHVESWHPDRGTVLISRE